METKLLPQQTWIERFSHREVEILALISEGLSNQEISRKLLLSPETVKWYNKQMFAKLGVNSRTQAVKKAEALGLLAQRPMAAVDEPRHAGHNLPSQLSSFVGREQEIGEIRHLLRASRLVVLTGPGGCGKSRLAAQVAAGLVDVYRDGVWQVEFASIRDPALVANALVQTLQINVGSDGSLVEVLKRFLARKHLLLLLDNLEHLPEAYPLVGELLAAAAQVTVLATSRERLHISGEQEYPVHPFRLPEAQAPETKVHWRDYDAINLFLERARGVQPGLTADEAQLGAIARICARLDGLPLAIELAASLVRTLPLPVLAQRLDNNLDALPSGPRDLPARQRTLRATLDWSYHLLLDDEKAFFARLAIFRGGSTLEAIVQLCPQGQDLTRDPIDVLNALVEKNLVYPRQGSGGEQRFWMLETIHEYAAERLAESNEAESLRARHADYYTRLVETAAEEFHSARQADWFARLRAEQANLQAAFLWSFGEGQADYGLRLVAALHYYWFYNGLAAEGRRWADLALERSVTAAPALRAGVLRCAGRIAMGLSEMRRGKEWLRQAVELYAQIGDERNAAWSRVFWSNFFVEDPSEFAEGMGICAQGLEALRQLADKPGMAQALNSLGELARLQGDYESAWRYYDESLTVAAQTGERQREAVVLNNLSFVAYHRHDYRQALRLVQKSLLVARELDNEYRQACFLATAAGPLLALGQPERAAQLLSASYARFEALGTQQQPADQVELELFRSVARQHLTEPVFEAAWQAGQELKLPEAVSLALAEIE